VPLGVPSGVFGYARCMSPGGAEGVHLGSGVAVSG
jgi:hypothetical protein